MQDMLMLAVKMTNRSATDREQLKASELQATVPAIQTDIAEDVKLHSTAADVVSASFMIPVGVASSKPLRASDICKTMPTIDEEAGSYCSAVKTLV